MFRNTGRKAHLDPTTQMGLYRYQSPTHLGLDRPRAGGHRTFQYSALTTLDRATAGECSLLYRPRNLRGAYRDGS
jgi:hypothetical protein